MLAIDFHSHLMPGVDDGSRSPVETIAMARGLAGLGVERVHLTPHQYKLENRFSLLSIQRNTDTVWHILARAEIRLEVRRGAEYYYGEQLLDAIAAGEELITFDHEGEPHILIELPMNQPAVGVRQVGRALLRRGVRPLMAHPERTRGLSAEFDRILGWREAGWKFQLNLLSLTGRHGREAEHLAHMMVDEALYDCAGSDLHRPSQLPWLQEAHEAFKSLTLGVSQP